MASLTASPSTGWEVHRSAGPAGPFHHRDVPQGAVPQVWLHRVERPALVLGSTQRDDVVDHEAAARLRVEVVRRRSGGGLVLVQPGHSRWVDVVVPRSHRRWDDDVGRASHWLGETWVEAVAAALPSGHRGDVAHHTGPLVRTPWSSVLCFAGLGPGEVTVGGRKVVGISQRRTRHAARFQCLVLRDGDLELMGRLVQPAALPAPVGELAGLAIGHDLDLDLAVERFLAGLD